MTPTLVELEHVSLTYGRGDAAVHAIRDVSGRVGERDSLAIVGPSGSGKSSLLHLIAGLEKPTSGTVRWPAWGGTPRMDPTVVGVMFQAPSLVPSLDVLENVALPLTLGGVPDADAFGRATAALEALHLASLVHALPEDLSGGQAQRVNLARVLAARPALLLADEPTGQLDRRTADEVLDVIIGSVIERGIAIVVSTHDERVAARFAGRWTVRDGAVTAVGEAVSA
ncbi:MAG TPA: ATP-binding cassette domain-containing protein [Amnibacterium sp.]|jgi:putative ABC transport system ATP-binding protein|nr:ATP-binding cassette domain-containing protein [Amnibacterium sp.]